MRDYQPSNDGFADRESHPLISGDDLPARYYKWMELDEQTHKNLTEFENPHFELASNAVGVKDVALIVSAQSYVPQSEISFPIFIARATQ
jgi:hypothetical protein